MIQDYNMPGAEQIDLAHLCQYHVREYIHSLGFASMHVQPIMPVTPSECRHPEHDPAFEQRQPEAKRVNDEWRRIYERPAVVVDPATDLGTMDCFNCARRGLRNTMHKHADGYWRCDECGRKWSHYFKSDRYP